MGGERGREGVDKKGYWRLWPLFSFNSQKLEAGIPCQ